MGSHAAQWQTQSNQPYLMLSLFKGKYRPGQKAEQLALKFLKKEGLVLLSKNFHSRFGEIDLIMKQGKTLVFIEVRYRRHERYDDALGSIGPAKIKKILKTAEYYILRNRLEYTPVRFDVVAIDGELKRKNIRWIKQALP